MRRGIGLALLATLVLTSPAQAKPVVLMFHGGGFVEGRASIPDAERAARQAGFRPVEIDYTLGHLPSAVRDARRAAKRRNGRAFAYGESAGGTLAALVAQAGLVRRAVAFMPAVDLVGTFANPLMADYADRLNATPDQLHRWSPIHRRTRNPILAQIAVDDLLVDPAVSLGWAERARRVRAQQVPGNHIYPPNQADRLRQLQTGFAWLT